jgi:hypothetical protein
MKDEVLMHSCIKLIASWGCEVIIIIIIVTVTKKLFSRSCEACHIRTINIITNMMVQRKKYHRT